MADPLEALEDWAGPVLRALEPGERRKLATELARRLRRNQQQRIAAQKNPDGTAYTPRKPRDLRGKAGHIKRRAAMFTKLRTARYLKAKGDAQAVTLSFAGRIARIARVHQYGLKDRAERGAPEVRYPERQLLGLTDAALELIRDGVLEHIPL
ncbi:phage virion morphogenesis protein [Pseudomonas citronellolis]|uniref:phage virion morphogenesis protein n=1 Tax=Pseudomonas citronellolis TaxID=53408 RepID=UPI0023E3E290|nr:phage virion morphogenesis protein [Pseudomonas citronellolis]MDF3935354.1 phage virion morphogenesis protein [Pseudomonas citronellolis]